MSSGGGGTTNTTQEFKPPSWTEKQWENYVHSSEKISQTPYQQSGLPTIAPINDYQQTAYQMAMDRAMYGASDLNAGRGAAKGAAEGDFANPWAQNIQNIAGGQSNPYTSDEYTNQMIADNSKNMAESYATGGAAQTDASFAMDGAFGGSAYQQAKAAGDAGLAKQVGQMATQTRAQQQQYKGSMYNQDIQNQLAANQQGGNFWNSDVGNMLSGAGLSGQLSQDDYKSIEGLNAAGNAQSGYYQKLMDALNNQWGTQNQYDATMNEYLGSALGRASGSYGSTASTQPGASPWGNIAGLLGTGAGLYSLYK